MPDDKASASELFISYAQEAIAEAEYNELYGVHFPHDTSEWTNVHKGILAKFLKANSDLLPEAKDQLLKTLKWRKEFQPLKAAFEEKHDDLFESLGVITRAPAGRIITWNLYGAVKEPYKLFARFEEFLRWRVGLMERGIALLDLGGDEEESTMDQVHDYMNVSFFRMDSATRKATKSIVQTFQNYYPEFLSTKYFVNVPMIMMWMFKLMRTMMSSDTAEKFKVVSNGHDLKYDLGDWLPQVYGGKGAPLKELAVESVKPEP